MLVSSMKWSACSEYMPQTRLDAFWCVVYSCYVLLSFAFSVVLVRWTDVPYVLVLSVVVGRVWCCVCRGCCIAGY